MKRIKRLLLMTACVFNLVCTSCNSQPGTTEKEVVLETTAGNIRLRLYNDTPGHRDNFIRNVEEGIYTGVTFHRIIRNFMIQTGDPCTRPQGYPVKIGENGDTIPETIPAEIVWPKHANVRGSLAAAREGDDSNPERASDRFQFYIVTGKTCTEDDLNNYETGRAQRDADLLYAKKQERHKGEIDKLRAARDKYALSDFLEKLQDEARYEMSENPPITYSKELRRRYKVHGGAPWLDNEYTVFGEVVEGMKTVEAIQKVKTDGADKPTVEIKVIKAYVVE